MHSVSHLGESRAQYQSEGSEKSHGATSNSQPFLCPENTFHMKLMNTPRKWYFLQECALQNTVGGPGTHPYRLHALIKI